MNTNSTKQGVGRTDVAKNQQVNLISTFTFFIGV